MASGMVVILASPLTMLRACLCPVASVDGMVMTAEGAEPCVERGRAWRVPKAPVLPRSKAVLCPRVVAHARRGSYRGEKYKE